MHRIGQNTKKIEENIVANLKPSPKGSITSQISQSQCVKQRDTIVIAAESGLFHKTHLQQLFQI